MMLGLEVIGAVEEVREDETPPTGVASELARLRATHHAVARLDARGLDAVEISAQTGYAPQSIRILRRDPSYRELVAFYQADAAQVAEQIEEQFLGIAKDYAQIIHAKADKPEEVSLEEALNVFKTFADRAGYAPVQRSVNKNLNLNIGARLDAARARKS